MAPRSGCPHPGSSERGPEEGRAKLGVNGPGGYKGHKGGQVKPHPAERRLKSGSSDPREGPCVSSGLWGSRGASGCQGESPSKHQARPWVRQNIKLPPRNQIMSASHQDIPVTRQCPRGTPQPLGMRVPLGILWPPEYLPLGHLNHQRVPALGIS